MDSRKDRHGVHPASASHWQCDLISYMSLSFLLGVGAQPSQPSFEHSVPLLSIITALMGGGGGLLAWAICFNQLNKAPSPGQLFYC